MTRDVGQYSPNPWGFYDMSGNVWELTADWHAGYTRDSQVDPEQLSDPNRLVVLGPIIQIVKNPPLEVTFFQTYAQ